MKAETVLILLGVGVKYLALDIYNVMQDILIEVHYLNIFLQWWMVAQKHRKHKTDKNTEKVALVSVKWFIG